MAQIWLKSYGGKVEPVTILDGLTINSDFSISGSKASVLYNTSMAKTNRYMHNVKDVSTANLYINCNNLLKYKKYNKLKITLFVGLRSTGSSGGDFTPIINGIYGSGLTVYARQETGYEWILEIPFQHLTQTTINGGGNYTGTSLYMVPTIAYNKIELIK